jgi:hypothetical protein
MEGRKLHCSAGLEHFASARLRCFYSAFLIDRCNGQELIVIQRYRFSLFLLFWCAFVFSVSPLSTSAQTEAKQTTAQTTGQTQKDPVPDKASHVSPIAVAGNWQVSWQGRLGAEPVALHLQQDGAKLTGTFQDLHGVMPLSGTVDEKKISFEVQFKGPRPFTTQFTGTVDGDKIEGTSQAVGVEGGGGAFLGHGGEVVHPEHPWTGKRIANQPTVSGRTGSSQAESTQTGSNPRPSPNSPAKN